ncbi:hypothetical protein MKK67_00520 [Methylobacterium sp. J-072]|uniref:hypothetical protein n=1 Tax=Methylobacterium sp. J-072 TaxID=2836651 RepID=UPI001FB9FEC1|nr:hypothetical protein [Methylobacterium sp. J-072]MCJ2090999.1 hypothetical protein [Methylobacterium sp. J-072]
MTEKSKKTSEAGHHAESSKSKRSTRRTALLHPEATAHLLKSISAAGHGPAFKQLSTEKRIKLSVHLENKNIAYRTSLGSLVAIHDFVKANIPNDRSVSSLWDCNPNDPYDLCWGARS